jgi:DNA-binding LacI/PurR family transcriptional regulator
MKNLLLPIAIAFSLAAFTSSCSRAICVSESAAKQAMQPGKKVFVVMYAPYATHAECLDLMPRITKELRERGFTVTSSVTNALTTEEVKARHVQRMAEFKADYIMTIGIPKPEKHEYISPKGEKMVTYKRKYAFDMVSASTDERIWFANAHGYKRLYGFYHQMLTDVTFSVMEKAGLIATVKKKKFKLFSASSAVITY